MSKPFPGLAQAVVLLLFALAAQVGFGFLGIQLGGRAIDSTLLAGLVNLVALGSVTAAGFWYSRERPPVRTVPGQPRPFFWGVVLAAGGATVVLGEVANLTAWVLPLPPVFAELFNRLLEGSLLVSLFTLSVVAPVTEEALFRGLLLRGLAARYGRWPGILISSACFALFHLNPWQAVPAFLAGLYLGWLFLVTGSLLLPMIAHGLFNGLPVMLAAAGLSIRGYNTPTTGPIEFQPVLWVAGGAVVLAAGLWMTRTWAPLSPRPVSDTVGP